MGFWSNTGGRGRAGEALATAYLELIGWTIEARNQRIAGVEVDLLAADGAARVLVEVKVRSRADYGGAAAAVDHTKRVRLVRAAHGLEPGGRRPVRIDVVAIELDGDGASIRHYRNAVSE
jgi:putative endonuclease